MSYKYKIIHVLTGNTIGVCYDGKKRSKNYRLQEWLSQDNKYLNKQETEIVNEKYTGIQGFFLSTNRPLTDKDGFTYDFPIIDFSYTNKATLKALINDFNFLFDISMDFYDLDDRYSMFKKLRQEGKNILSIPSEFEIVRIK